MISIRNARYAKQGLSDMLDHIENIGMDLKNETIIEIGSYVGDSTYIFARRFKKVIAIDPFENGYDDTDPASYQHPMSDVEAQFDELCKEYKNIEKWRMDSIEAPRWLEYDLAFVYIDARHNYQGVQQDIKIYSKLIRPGGWLCGHDYQGKFPGVIKAVDEFKKPDMVFRDTSWCIRL